jgi:hypothetical protein
MSNAPRYPLGVKIEIRSINHSQEQPRFFPVLHANRPQYPWRLTIDGGKSTGGELLPLMAYARKTLTKAGGFLVIYGSGGNVTQASEWIEACEIEPGAPRGLYIERHLSDDDMIVS